MSKVVDPGESVMDPAQLPAVVVDSEVDTPAEPKGEVEPIQLEVTLLIPRQSFAPVSQHTDGDASHLALLIPIQTTDAIRDLVQLIADAKEGFWLGAFGLIPVTCKAIPAKEEPKEGVETVIEWGPWEQMELPTLDTSLPSGEVDVNYWKLGRNGVLGDFADLTNIFGGDQTRFEGMKRGLKVIPTSYAPAPMSMHILRLRDNIFSTVSSIGTHATYDPTSIAISGGTSLYASIRGTPTVTPSEPAPEPKSTSKGKQSNKSAAPSPPVVASAPAPGRHAFTGFTISDLKPLTSFKNFPAAVSPAFASPCVKSFSLSPWGPPPHTLRMKGHIIYLVVTTIEGETFHVTGATNGFWVSKSTTAHFDPSPRLAPPRGLRATPYHSLFELFSALSPAFVKGLIPLIEKNNPSGEVSDIFAAVPISHATPAASWLVPTPIHTADPFRTQLAYLLTGSTQADLLPPARDWNDDAQMFKELPASTLQQKIGRERLISRAQADFLAAATKGVMSIIRGDIPPLNPNEPEAAHTFVHNNMLFTRAEDTFVRVYAHVGGDEASRVAALKDLRGVGILDRLEVPNLYTMATVIVDYCGERYVVQSLIPGLFKTKEQEEAAVTEDKPHPSIMSLDKDDYPPSGTFRIVYGSAVPETPDQLVRSSGYFGSLAQKVAEQLHLAEHAVFDSQGRETQLWLSTDVHGIAGPDGRSYVIDCSRLHCVDIEFLEKDTAGPIYTDSTDTVVNGVHDAPKYPHRMLLLRPELLVAYRASKLQKWIEEKVLASREKIAEAEAAKVAAGESTAEALPVKAIANVGDTAEEIIANAPPQTVINAADFKLSFNPDAFVERAPGDGGAKATVIYDPEAESTKEVRNASVWLRESGIPGFVIDAVLSNVGFTDGQFLTKLMHRKGINVRYLGLLAKAVDQDGPTLDYGKNATKDEIAFGLKGFKRSLQDEMISRSAKHILNRLLRSANAYDHPHVISHFLNCLLGSALNSTPIATTADTYQISAVIDRSWTSLTPASVRSQIIAETEARYRYALPVSALGTSLRHTKLLREICLRVGIQLVLRPYDFGVVAAPVVVSKEVVEVDAKAEPTAPATASSRSKKQKATNGKAAAVESSASEKIVTSFRVEDVLNIMPVVKSNIHKSSVAEDTFEAGQNAFVEGNHEFGTECMTDALGLYEQVFGAIHSEGASVHHKIALLYHSLATTLVRQIEQHEQVTAKFEAMPEEMKAEVLPQLPDLLLPDVNAARADSDMYLNSAVVMMRQSVIISERTNGLDASETIQQYADLGLLENGIGNFEAGLKLTRHAIDLHTTVYGPDHPSILDLLRNATEMIQLTLGVVPSLPLLQQCQAFSVSLYGERSSQNGMALFALAQAIGIGGDFIGSIALSKTSIAIFTEVYGPESTQVKEAATFMQYVIGVVRQSEERAEEVRLRQIAAAAATTAPVTMAPRVRNLANEERLRKKFPGIASASTTSGAEKTSLAVDAPVARPHGEKAELSVEELEKYINGSASSSAHRKRKPAATTAAATS